MANLVIVFDGMSLIVSNELRSEAFFVGTNKVKTSHAHEHVVKVGNDEVSLSDALVWVEGPDGTRLSGPVDVTGPFMALLDTIAPGSPLAPEMTVDNPDEDRKWLEKLDVWLRLPGGVLDTAPTATAGGNLKWTFPAVNEKSISRRLTQTGILTSTNVTGPLRLALKDMQSDEVKRYAIPQGASGDFRVDVQTRFDTTALATAPIPSPSTTVTLDEMQLVYECLASGKGPIPSAIWPSAPHAGIPLFVTSDPATGICPLAFRRPIP